MSDTDLEFQIVDKRTDALVATFIGTGDTNADLLRALKISAIMGEEFKCNSLHFKVVWPYTPNQKG